MSDKIKCCFYCRVSTKSTDQQNSFENQKMFFYDFLSKNKDKYTIYKDKSNDFSGIYADKGISGTLLHREHFEQMLWECGLDCQEYTYTVDTRTDIDDKTYNIEYKDYKIQYNENSKNPKFREIIVKSTSRFARNILVTEILRKLTNIGVYVTFLDINKSTRNTDDLMIIQLFQQFDEMFSRDLSKKLLSANKQSAENQILRTNHDLFGYKYISRRVSKKSNNELKIIESEANIIRMLYRLYLGCHKVVDNKPTPMQECDFICSKCEIYKTITTQEGLGLRLLPRTLNTIYNFKTRKGGTFKPTTIKHILENEKYAGYLNNRKYDHGTVFNRTSQASIRDDYTLVYRPDLIEPIISKELYDLCTDKRLERAGDVTGRFLGKATTYKGLIKCGGCGSVYIHTKSKDGKGYYLCKNKKVNTKSACTNTSVFDWQIDEELKKLGSGLINELIQSENILVIGALVKEIEEKIDFINRTRDTEHIKELSTTIEKGKIALQRLITDKALSDFPDVFNGPINDITERLNQDTSDYDKITKKPLAYIEECLNLFNICGTIITMSENTQSTYTDNEVLELLDFLVIYGEPVRVNGLWKTPNPSIVPVLKITATAKKLIDYDVNVINSKNLVYDMGIVGTTDLDEIKNYLNILDKKLDTLKNVYMK